MTDKIDLRRIEKKIYLSYHKDGLWDILLGLFFIAMGLLFYYNLVSYLVIFPAAFLPTIMIVKKSFAESRLGYVVFSRERQAKEKTKILLMIVLCIFGLLSGLMAFFAALRGRAFYNFLDSLPAFPMAIFIAVVIAAVSAVYGIWRFTGYALLIFLIFFIGNRINDQVIGPSILTGIFIFLIGLVIFIRFMRKYPKIKGGIRGEIIDKS